MQFSIEYPHLGQQKVALKVKAEYVMDISPGGVRSIWLRQNMNTAALRVARAKSIKLPDVRLIDRAMRCW